MDGFFSATPPLEALQIILADIANSSGDKTLMVNDVSRAFFYAKAIRDPYGEIPEEARGKDDGDKCWKLLMSLYGTRNASANWHHTYAEHLISIGFRQHSGNPCLFYHEAPQLRSLVHGDDCATSGTRAVLHWMKQELQNYSTSNQKYGGIGQARTRRLNYWEESLAVMSEGCNMKQIPDMQNALSKG